MSALDWTASFDALSTGQTLGSRGRTLTEADLVAFSALTGDFHPQHTDADWAAASRFGERIAHGMLIASYAVGLIPFDPERVLALRRITDLVFKRPAGIGTTIHVAGRISSLRRVSADAGLVALRLDIRDSSERVLCRAQLEVLWAAEDAQAPSLEAEIDLPAGVIPC